MGTLGCEWRTGEGRGWVGKLTEHKALSSAAGQLLLVGVEVGVSSCRGLKLGPNPFHPGCHPWVKMTEAAECPPGGHQKQDSHGPLPSWAEARGQSLCQASKVHDLTPGPAVPDPQPRGLSPGRASSAWPSAPGEGGQEDGPTREPLEKEPKSPVVRGPIQKAQPGSPAAMRQLQPPEVPGPAAGAPAVVRGRIAAPSHQVAGWRPRCSWTRCCPR